MILSNYEKNGLLNLAQPQLLAIITLIGPTYNENPFLFSATLTLPMLHNKFINLSIQISFQLFKYIMLHLTCAGADWPFPSWRSKWEAHLVTKWLLLWFSFDVSILQCKVLYCIETSWHKRTLLPHNHLKNNKAGAQAIADYCCLNVKVKVTSWSWVKPISVWAGVTVKPKLNWSWFGSI